MVNNIFMCSKKTAKILGLFYIFLLYSSNSAIEEEENEFKEELPEKDNFNEKNIKTGNAFVKFFKYGKHSLLWDGISGPTVGLIIEGVPHFPCFIRQLIAARYNFKSPIKNNIGYFVSLVFGGDSSFFDFISFLPSCNFLSLNLGIYYTILQKKSFSWDLHAGIGFSWRWSPFCSDTSYDADYRNLVNERTKNYKNNQKDMGFTNDFEKPEIKDLIKNGSYLKHYFYPVNFLDNIKHFDILLDLSIFDFTIKNHFKISLSWHCGIAYMFYFFKREKILEKVFNGKWENYGSADVLMYLGLKPLTISIGYVF